MGFQDFHEAVHRAASRKGGRIRVSKGFGKNRKLAAEAGRKGGLQKHANRNKKSGPEEVSSGGNTGLLEKVLGDLDE